MKKWVKKFFLMQIVLILVFSFAFFSKNKIYASTLTSQSSYFENCIITDQ